MEGFHLKGRRKMGLENKGMDGIFMVRIINFDSHFVEKCDDTRNTVLIKKRVELVIVELTAMITLELIDFGLKLVFDKCTKSVKFF